jgi:hypothetical protein
MYCLKKQGKRGPPNICLNAEEPVKGVSKASKLSCWVAKGGVAPPYHGFVSLLLDIIS